ncbi:MAG: mechanosensitive ion channel domain-containing protein [Pseudomonadota bacterium]
MERIFRTPLRIATLHQHWSEEPYPDHAKRCGRSVWSFLAVLICVLCLGLAGVGPASAQSDASEDDDSTSETIDSAPVEIDGERYFMVRGARSFTAEERASLVVKRILDVAETKAEGRAVVEIREGDQGSAIFADGRFIVLITEADAEFEGLELVNVANVIAGKTADAITNHRLGRGNAALDRGLRYAALWTLGLVVVVSIVWLIRRLFRRYIEGRIRIWIGNMEKKSGQVINARSTFRVARTLLRGVFIFLYCLIAYVYAYVVLAEFAPTRAIAFLLIDVLADPFVSLGQAAVQKIPDLIVLFVIFLFVKFLLSVIRLFFENVERGVIRIDHFEQGWVWPTFRIVRVIVIIAAIIVAYPYIPGSGTEAFQGMTIFLGVLVTLSSGSVASNLIAGLFVIYKRSVNIGDRIKVGEVVGDVESISFVDTQLRSVKNELISVPNTSLLSNTVINFTRIGTTTGLLVHVTVGIGYDEVPEQVEQLLIAAAGKTSGLQPSPEPFVLTTGLGSHDVAYEINAFLEPGQDLIDTRSRLCSNILAEFNAARVQIMTPFYVADPAEPKVAELPSTT